MTFSSNPSDRSTNDSKDVSISSVPLVGKRDSIEVTKVLSDGTQELTTYRNSYDWEASDDMRERLEQWLCLRSDVPYQCLLTFVSFRVWSSLAAVLLTYANPLGLVLVSALVLCLSVLVFVSARSLPTLAASSLRLFVVAVAVFS
jgi:hypothetical protein